MSANGRFLTAKKLRAAKDHPEGVERAAAAALEASEESGVREVSLGGRTTNTGVQYFFALIAFSCLSGAYLGIKTCCDGQANLSALGARRSVSPMHKLKGILADFAVLDDKFNVLYTIRDGRIVYRA